MAKIGDLVKTYRLLSDPDAPDWNVKFVGALAIAAVVVAAGAGALLWSLSGDEAPAAATPAAQAQEPADVEAECALAPTAPPVATPPACPDAPQLLP